MVFLVTLPAIMWNGIQVNATHAEGSQQVVSTRSETKDELVTVSVQPDGLRLNRKPVSVDELPALLRQRLVDRSDKTVVIVPSDLVALGEVVTVLDIAKASGATSLALLNLKGEG